MQPANLILLVLILGAFYLLILRPAKARQRQQLELQRQVEPGVTIMTTSGLFGTVTEVDDDSVHLEIAPGIVARFSKAAIGRVVPEPVDDEVDEADDLDDVAPDGSPAPDSDVERPETPGGGASDSGSIRPDEPRDRAAG